MVAPQSTLGHYRGGSLTHPMLITCVLHIWPEGHREPRNEVGSLSPAEHIVGFEPGTFRFWSQCLNPLGHFPHAVPYAVIPKKSCIPCLDLGEGMFFITFDYLEKSPFLIFCVPRILVRSVQKRTCPCLVSDFWTLFKTCSFRMPGWYRFDLHMFILSQLFIASSQTYVISSIYC